MKKALSLLLAASLTASAAFTGCSGSSGATTGSSPQAPANSTAASSTASSVSGTVTLLSWYNQEQMKDVKAGFEAAYPGTTLDVQYVPPTNQYVEKFEVLMSSNEPTDLFYMGAENKDDIIKNQFADDLSSLPVMSKMNKTVKDIYGDGSKVYGLSVDAWVGGLFYNKDLFQKAGISSEPKTSDELYQDMAKLKKIGVQPLTAQAEDVDRLMFGLFASNEVTKDPDIEKNINDGKTTFSKEYKATMDDWYKNVISTGYLSKVCLGLSSDQAETMFATGKAAMLVGGPWNINDFKSKNPNLKYDMFAIPGKDGKSILQGAPNVAFSVAAKGKNKTGAYAFLNYITSTKGLEAYQKVTGQVLMLDGANYTLNPTIAKFKEQAVAGNFYWQPMTWKNSANVLKEFTVQTQNILSGTSTVDAALADINTKIKG